jgi:hypothetical protein
MKDNYLKSLFIKYRRVCWNIGFVDFNPQTIFDEKNLTVRWMKHGYKDRWFADPFILTITNQNIIVLAEEFYYPLNRGRIARLIIDKNSLKLKSSEIVLELDSHLSFPAIFRYGDDIYIYPESSTDGNLILYKYDELKNTVKPASVLSNEPLTDAIITSAFNNSHYIFSTMLPHQNENSLGIYFSKEWNGIYELDYMVYFKDNTARNAGELFKIGDNWIRPAQDCNGDYGKGIVFQEVSLLSDRFSFNELKRFYPNSKKWNLGMHTFNTLGNIAVVDAKRYKYPITGKLLLMISKGYKFIK